MNSKETAAPSSLRPVFILSATLLAWMAGPGGAAGVESGEGDKLIKEGIQLRRAGRDSDALMKFEHAYSLSSSPRAAAQLGLCQQALSRWVDADRNLAEALTAANDPWVGKNRDVIKEALEQVKTHIGRVEVLGKPEGATVTINGRLVGTLPLPQPIPVSEGGVDIEVTADAYEPEYKVLQVAGASLQSVVIRLKRRTVPTPVAGEGAPPQGAGVLQTGTEATQDESKPITKSAWFWVGAVALVGGVVFGAILLSGGGARDPKFDDSISFK